MHTLLKIQAETTAGAQAAGPEDLTAEYERIVARLPTRAPIFLPTEKVPLAERVEGVKRVEAIYRDRLDQVYRPRLRALREKYAGTKRAFVIGNGPSLNRTDLAALKDEVVFAMNGFFLKMPELDWVPTFYVVEDHLVAEDRAAAINALRGPTKLFPVYLGYCMEEQPGTIFFNHRPRKSYPHGFDFSLDAAAVTYTGCTVTNTTLQLAHYLGFQEIYLIGVDADYGLPADVKQSKDYGVGVLDMKSDDPNHFHPDYFGKGYRWHDPQVDKMLEAYQETERVTRGTGRYIYNAGVGGKLEVFQRVPFTTVLPQARSPEEMDRLAAEREAARPPRMLLLDMTRVGGGTATGELKRALMSDWPDGRILQIYAAEGQTICVSDRHTDDRSAPNRVTAADAAQRAKDFAPEVILYRPVPDKPALHALAMEVIAASSAPLAVWVMDDWMERMRAEDPEAWPAMERDIQWLLGRASLRLSISPAMSDAMAARYGGTWSPFANGVDPAEWPAMREAVDAESRRDRLLIRFAGSLAEDMTLQSVADVAQAVARLGAQHRVRFEVNTRLLWVKRNGKALRGLRNVSVSARALDSAAYRQWLGDADVALIAYNFDEKTRRYVHASMANKAPECLASGAAVFAYGPAYINTIAQLSVLGCTEVLTDRSPEKLDAVLLRLLTDFDRRIDLGRRGRETAFSQFSLPDCRRRFVASLRGLTMPAGGGVAPAAPVAAAEAPMPTDRLMTLEAELAAARSVIEELRTTIEAMRNPSAQAAEPGAGGHPSPADRRGRTWPQLPVLPAGTRAAG